MKIRQPENIPTAIKAFDKAIANAKIFDKRRNKNPLTERTYLYDLIEIEIPRIIDTLNFDWSADELIQKYNDKIKPKNTPASKAKHPYKYIRNIKDRTISLANILALNPDGFELMKHKNKNRTSCTTSPIFEILETTSVINIYENLTAMFPDYDYIRDKARYSKFDKFVKYDTDEIPITSWEAKRKLNRYHKEFIELRVHALDYYTTIPMYHHAKITRFLMQLNQPFTNIPKYTTNGMIQKTSIENEEDLLVLAQISTNLRNIIFTLIPESQIY